MKRSTKVGTYRIGPGYVDLWVVSGEDGYCTTSDEHGKRPRIEIGADGPWAQTVGTLLHEAVELVTIEMGLRYRPDPDYGNGQDAYAFHFAHPQFTELCARVGMFLTDALPAFSKAYKHRQK